MNTTTTTQRATAQIFNLPSATMEPVNQVRQRGRLPGTVASLNRARLKTREPETYPGEALMKQLKEDRNYVATLEGMLTIARHALCATDQRVRDFYRSK